MDDYLSHQRDELCTNKWEEEYQGGYEILKKDNIERIHKDGNDNSYDGYIGAEVQTTDGSGNLWIRKVLKRRKVISR